MLLSDSLLHLCALCYGNPLYSCFSVLPLTISSPALGKESYDFQIQSGARSVLMLLLIFFKDFASGEMTPLNGCSWG